MSGKVKWFNVRKGYGFISANDGKEYFVHYSAIQSDGFRKLRQDQEVNFDLEDGKNGVQATNVIPA